MLTYKRLKAFSLTSLILMLSSTVQANDNGLHPFFLNGGPANKTTFQNTTVPHSPPATQISSQSIPASNSAPSTTAASSNETGQKVTSITNSDGPFNQIDRPDEHFQKNIINEEDGRVETKENIGAQPYNPKLSEGKVLNKFNNNFFGDLLDFRGENKQAQENKATQANTGNTAINPNTSATQQTPSQEQKESAIPGGPRRDTPSRLHRINLF